MGTSTGVTTNHGTSAMAIANHDCLSQDTFTEIKSCPDTSGRETEADGAASQKGEKEGRACSEQSALQMSSGSRAPLEQMEKRRKGDSTQDVISLSESMKRMLEGRSGRLCFLSF